MILLNKEIFPARSSLFSYNNLKINRVDVFKKKIEIEDVININEVIFLPNPNYDDLKLLRDLKKEVVLFLEKVDGEVLDFIGKDFVKQIFVIDKNDAYFLENKKIKNFDLVWPACTDIKPDIEYNFACNFTNLKDLDIEDVEYLKGFTNNFKVAYCGLKKLENKKDFDLLMSMNYSKIFIREFPIFKYKNLVVESSLLIDIVKEKQNFPIEFFYNFISNKEKQYDLIRTGIVYSKKYFKWVLKELQSPAYQDVSLLYKFNKVDEINLLQREKIDEEFSPYEKIEEVICY
jgi:hypothetical protein